MSAAIGFTSSATKENEPPHIHVKAGGDEAKFWLDPIQLAANYGFHTRHLTEIAAIIGEHQTGLLHEWNKRFKRK